MKYLILLSALLSTTATAMQLACINPQELAINITVNVLEQLKQVNKISLDVGAYVTDKTLGGVMGLMGFGFSLRQASKGFELMTASYSNATYKQSQRAKNRCRTGAVLTIGGLVCAATSAWATLNMETLMQY